MLKWLSLSFLLVGSSMNLLAQGLCFNFISLMEISLSSYS
ncbi:hypothetical protein LINGRAPRIM_LOCUS1744 [Linum grandiflorum]